MEEGGGGGGEEMSLGNCSMRERTWERGGKGGL